MEINVITFAAHLVKQLTQKIEDHFQRSVDDYFQRISDAHNLEISLLKFDGNTLKSSKVLKYVDGTVREANNLWDVLSSKEQEEAKELINLVAYNNQRSRGIREQLLSIAQRTQEVNDKNEIKTFNLTAYAKFFSCLPDFILNDTELLLRTHPAFPTLSEKDLVDIKNHTATLNPQELADFAKANSSEELHQMLASVFSLEFLVDYDF